LSADAYFRAYLRTAGLAPAGDVVLVPGQLVRYRGEGDKSGARNCWAILHTSPDAWGVAGSWRTGQQVSWREQVRPHMTRAERRELKRQADANEAARRHATVEVQAAAREKAARLWGVARPATDAHPYLKRKGVHAYGLRQLGERLLIPARDRDGVLHTLQFIDADGTKRFLTGGRIAGCYLAIGTPGRTLLVAEGYATAASLHMATGFATAAAFSAGNLGRVAIALRCKFPSARIVICADDDAGTPGNPGLTAAKGAARAAGGLVARPKDLP
jgi:putative DNA primase/helicase